MVYCRAFPVKKLVPLEQLVAVSSCTTDCAFEGCAAYQEARERVEHAADEGALVDELTAGSPAHQDPGHPGKGRTP